jgi:hypothetical protein
MNKSITTTAAQYEKQHITRFRRLDNTHISAIESLYRAYPFLNNRIEIHMPYQRGKQTFSSEKVWVWPKFDKRPVGYLIFIDGFPPCIWYPDRQEGMTFRWLLPPNFCQYGPTICLANILSGESTLQIEDIIIKNGKDLWSSCIFSERWTHLRDFWNSLPPEQPLLAFKPQIVKPITLSEWELHYNPSIYWIIQPDHVRQPRWFWKDVINAPQVKQYIPPTLKRKTEITSILCALCIPYTKTILPDTYTLLSQEGDNLGFASISTLDLSIQLRKLFENNTSIKGVPVEVIWNSDFNKYKIIRIMPENTPITTSSFFYHKEI